MSNSEGASGPKNVSIFHRINRLRIKAAGKAEGPPGQIDPEAIRKADEFIGEVCADCRTVLGASIEKLVTGWERMRELPDSEERKAAAQAVFHIAHEIKDISGMCGYALLSHFSESLRDYVVETDLDMEARRVIVQAHVDAIQAVYRLDIKAESVPEAEALKQAVQQAIKKYR